MLVLAPLPMSGMPRFSFVTLQPGQPAATVLSKFFETSSSHGKSGVLTDSTLPLAFESEMNQLPRILPFSPAYSELDGLAITVSSIGTLPVNDGMSATPAFLYSATFCDHSANGGRVNAVATGS